MAKENLHAELYSSCSSMKERLKIPRHITSKPIQTSWISVRYMETVPMDSRPPTPTVPHVATITAASDEGILKLDMAMEIPNVSKEDKLPLVAMLSSMHPKIQQS
jgi:hypothetical protein